MPCGLIVDVPVVDVAWALSPLEEEILNADETLICYDNIVEAITYDELDISIAIDGEPTVADEIMGLYIEALSNYPASGALNEVITMTNQYISLVNESDELSDKEKEVLYGAFSVGVYSYMYWSTHE